MATLDGQIVGIDIARRQADQLTRVEVCFAIATLAVIVAAAFIICLH